MKGQLLETSTSNVMVPEAALKTAAQATANRRMRRTRAVAGWVAAVVVAGLALWAVLQITMDVPDAASPVTSNHLGVVDAGNSIGQTFVPERNNLDKMSVLLNVKNPNDYSSFTFTIRDGGPSGRVLRTVKLQISSLPQGAPFRYDNFHSAILDPVWYTFTFEPIPDSAKRRLSFLIEGKYIPPPSEVGVAMMFHSSYPQGTAFVNGGEQNANVVFRTYVLGRVQDYLNLLATNLTASKPGPLGNSATYITLGAAYVVLLGALLTSARYALRG